MSPLDPVILNEVKAAQKSISDLSAAASSHVGSTGDAHGVATTSVAGFMSAADKTKLDSMGSGGDYTHPTSGVTSGTYKSVTVNDQGHVTGGTNPTTLAEYGITDAQALDADLTAIATLSGTSGLLKKTAANTWSLDTNTYLTDNKTITISGDATGTGSTAIPLVLANSGVTAGTYKSVTVDSKGRVTSGANPTTLAGYGITDALNTYGNAVLPLVNADVTSASLMTSTASANQVVDSASSTTYRTAKYLIQATSGTYYHACEALVIHDGTTASLVVYGDVMTGPRLMILDVDVFDGNVRLLATPSNAATTIKIVRISING